MTLKGTQFHFRKSGNHTIIHNPSTSLFAGVYTCLPIFTRAGLISCLITCLSIFLVNITV